MYIARSRRLAPRLRPNHDGEIALATFGADAIVELDAERIGRYPTMTYQVLARKWRPKTFAELVGQEHVVTALTNAL